VGKLAVNGARSYLPPKNYVLRAKTPLSSRPHLSQSPGRNQPFLGASNRGFGQPNAAWPPTLARVAMWLALHGLFDVLVASRHVAIVATTLQVVGTVIVVTSISPAA
jgi:hypothetical protein